jgi:hypothetical protein
VIIPPPGGHGKDIYRELGAYKVLIYSRIENLDVVNPDFPVGNQFARVGIIKNPTVFGTNTVSTQSTVSATYGLRLTGAASTSISVEVDGQLTQTIGVGSTNWCGIHFNICRSGWSTYSDYWCRIYCCG